MVKCQKCGKRLRWDWSQDCFIIGDYNEAVIGPEEEDDKGVNYSCTCGEHLGRQEFIGDFTSPDWLKDVDFEEADNMGCIGLIKQQTEEV